MLHCNESRGDNLEFWSGQRRDDPSSDSQKSLESLETGVDVSFLSKPYQYLSRICDKF